MAMKLTSVAKQGEVIGPFSNFSFKGNCVSANGGSNRFEHSSNTNAMVVGGFLVAKKDVCPDEAIQLNFNQFCYKLENSFVDPSTGKTIGGFSALPEVEQQELYLTADEAVREEALRNGFVPLSNDDSNHIQVVYSNIHHSLVSVAKKDLAVGDVVFASTGVVMPFPLRSTVALPQDKHLRVTGGAEFLWHSCQPNMAVIVEGSVVRGVALRPISASETLTYNYLTTEWDIACPFRCTCNVFSCYGLVQGFKHLEPEQQQHLMPQVSPAIRSKCCEPLEESARLSQLTRAALVSPNSKGDLVALTVIPAGTVLFTVQRYRIGVREVFIDDIRIPHSCNPSAVVVEGHLVARTTLTAGEPLSVNVSLLAFKTTCPFVCTCGSDNCQRMVTGFDGMSDDDKDAMMNLTEPAVRVEATKNGYSIRSSSPYVTVRHNGDMGQATFAAKAIGKGTRFFKTTGLVIPYPTVYTILLAESRHLLFAGGAQCLAHSCDPNVRVVVDPSSSSFECVALRDIAAGELVAFNYLTTEWDMNTPFPCLCGSSRCYQNIRGFKHVNDTGRQWLWALATPVIRQLAAGQSKSLIALLNKAMLSVHNRELRSIADIPAGSVLFDAVRYTVMPNVLMVDDLQIPHSCDASAVLVEGKVVTRRPLNAGDAVTINLCLVSYSFEPFACRCEAWNCQGTVAGFHSMSDGDKDAMMNLTEPAVRVEATKNGYSIRSSSPYVTVRHNGDMGQATFAAKAIGKGTRFFKTTGLVIPYPTVYTILLAESRHLLFAGGAQCLAHSCDPNVRVVVDPSSSSFECVALRDIAAGELVAFNYLTTEWDMNTPFPCLCGSSRCYQNIRGFKHLNDDDRLSLWHFASPAIRSLVGNDGVSSLCRMDRSAMNVDAAGCLRAVNDIPSGKILLEVQRFNVRGNRLALDDLLLRHSCDPNVFVVNGKLLTAKVIPSGEELTVNVSLTEYRLAEPFECTCGSAVHCVGKVEGFSSLPLAEKHRLMIFVDPDVRVLAVKDGYTLESNCSLIQIRANGDMGQTTFAATKICKGSKFFRSSGVVIPFPTVYTILLAPGRNLLFAGGAHCLAHSCDPNVRVVVDPLSNSFELVAIKDIAEGEMVAFNYLTTEWDMNCPFPCLCGAPRCFNMIRGFKHLSAQERNLLSTLATSAVKELAGLHAHIELLPCVTAASGGVLTAKAAIARATVILDCANMELFPSHISVGGILVKHSLTEANTVYVEGRLVTSTDVAAGDIITVNMCYFVYDMVKLFPDTFVPDNKGFKYLDEKVKQYDLYLCEPPVRAQAMKDGWIVVSTNPQVTVRPNGDMGQTAYAAVDMPTGTVLFRTAPKGLIVPFPTMYTICLKEDTHLLFGDAAECIAHSCNPNVRVDVKDSTQSLEFVLCRDVAEGEMLSFCYNTTEWDMNSTFPCLCGSPLCARFIRGFKYLSNEDRQRLWPLTSDFIKRRTESIRSE